MSLKLFALVLALSFAVVAGTPTPLSLSNRPRGGRIVGGTESTPHSHSSIVSIQVGGHYCGGTIVNATHILTAAHCCTLAATRYTVLAGEHDLVTEEGTEQRSSVSNVVQHPQYSSALSRNDVCILELATPLELNEYVTAGNLAKPGFVPNEILEAYGWGTLTEGGEIPDKLQEVKVPFVTDAKCRAAYALVASIVNSMICAGEDGHDACQGDSGGPLTSIGENGTETLVGITSFGVGCARPRYPGVYSEVSEFYNWIVDGTTA